MPFVVAQNKRTLKHEYPFLGAHEVSTYSFLSQNDPYEPSKDEKLRAQWIEECKNLYGPFRPSGTQKPLSMVTKSQLRQIVEVLKKLLLSDWNDVNFIIGSKSLHADRLSEPQRLYRGEVPSGHRRLPPRLALLHEHPYKHKRRHHKISAAESNALLGVRRGQFHLLHARHALGPHLRRKARRPNIFRTTNQTWIS